MKELSYVIVRFNRREEDPSRFVRFGWLGEGRCGLDAPAKATFVLFPILFVPGVGVAAGDGAKPSDARCCRRS